MIIEDRILSLILNGPISYWNLLNSTNVLIRDFISVLGDLYRKKYIEYKNGFVSMTKMGKEYCLKKGIEPFVDHKCNYCKGRTVDLNSLPKDILDRYYKIQSNRPQSLSRFDQGFVTPDISLARCCYFSEKKDIGNCSIIFIGDDDLTSIAAALLGNYEQITVVDIDSRFIEFIRKTAKEENFSNFDAHVYDVREELPSFLKESFDVFFMDPVETILGFTLFLNRGIQSLKGKNCVGYFGLTYMEASLKKWYLFEKKLLEAGFIITDILEGFNLYDLSRIQKGKGYKVVDSAPFSVDCSKELWYNSSLFRIYSVDKPRVIDGVFEEIKGEEDFYLDEDGYVVSI